jgi:hypothetical protein
MEQDNVVKEVGTIMCRGCSHQWQPREGDRLELRRHYKVNGQNVPHAHYRCPLCGYGNAVSRFGQLP